MMCVGLSSSSDISILGNWRYIKLNCCTLLHIHYTVSKKVQTSEYEDVLFRAMLQSRLQFGGTMQLQFSLF